MCPRNGIAPTGPRMCDVCCCAPRDRPPMENDRCCGSTHSTHNRRSTHNCSSPLPFILRTTWLGRVFVFESEGGPPRSCYNTTINYRTLRVVNAPWKRAYGCCTQNVTSAPGDSAPTHAPSTPSCSTSLQKCARLHQAFTRAQTQRTDKCAQLQRTYKLAQ